MDPNSIQDSMRGSGPSSPGKKSEYAVYKEGNVSEFSDGSQPPPKVSEAILPPPRSPPGISLNQSRLADALPFRMESAAGGSHCQTSILGQPPLTTFQQMIHALPQGALHRGAVGVTQAPHILMQYPRGLLEVPPPRHPPIYLPNAGKGVIGQPPHPQQFQQSPLDYGETATTHTGNAAPAQAPAQAPRRMNVIVSFVNGTSITYRFVNVSSVSVSQQEVSVMPDAAQRRNNPQRGETNDIFISINNTANN